MNGNRIKVIFIAGAGRSGSTMLAQMLGLVDSVFSAGEIRYLWRENLLHDWRCGCNKPFSECVFWPEVIDRAFDGLVLDPLVLAGLADYVDRLYRIPQIMTGWTSAGYRKKLQEYSFHLERLYRAIHEVSGDRFIVDASKDPSSAYILSTMPEVDLSIIHLVRDSRAVAYSWQRKVVHSIVDDRPYYMPRFGVVRTAISWTYRNLMASLIQHQRVRYSRMRYADLVRRPFVEMSRLLAWLDPDLKPPSILQDRSLDMLDNHMMSANPIRFKKGAMKIKLDNEWESGMAPRQKRVVTLMTAPLLLQYGYKVFI